MADTSSEIRAFHWIRSFTHFSGEKSPEGITEAFPALNLEQVFGALAFYMANREIVDEYLRQGQGEFEALRERAQRNNPVLYRKRNRRSAVALQQR